MVTIPLPLQLTELVGSSMALLLLLLLLLVVLCLQSKILARLLHLLTTAPTRLPLPLPERLPDMANTQILTAATFSEWDPTTPVATIEATSDGNYRVSFAVGSWVTVPEGKDTAPVFSTFAEAQAIAEKFGSVMAEIKVAAATKIVELLQNLPDKKG